MKTFLFLFLAGCAVRCDDSNYYVVQMPDNDVLPLKDFRVYWNVPTMQCKSKKILFEDLYEKYGIIQNTDDTFRGDKISILYDPGDFPALLRNNTSGEIKYRNGGVPQEGDLITHLDTFQKVLEQSVPDKDFKGVGIIDFESWRPVLRQNFGTLTPYKDVSYEIEKKRHWWWKKQWVEQEAKRRFEEAAREFMQATVSLAKKMRPLAVWGYYGFPYCFNMANNHMWETCADNVPQENDRTSWLWQESTALYPSVYSSNDLSSSQLASLIRGRVGEAARVARGGAPILPYFWYNYRDNGYFTESDLDVALRTFYKSNASGFIIWGSSNDVNTLDKCENLKKYVTEILGPAIAQYTKRNIRVADEQDEAVNEVYNSNNASKFDPEYNWIPPVNYTQHVEEMVDKELKEEKEKETLAHKDVKESILVDMILHQIANYCVDGCDNKSNVRRTEEKEDAGVNESRVVLVTEDPFKKNDSGIAVTVSTTTEEDIYDYETTGDRTTGDYYDTDDYIDLSTVTKSIDKTSTTKIVEEIINTTPARTDEINIIDISRDDSAIFNQNNDENSTVNVNNAETSTHTISTTKIDNINFIIDNIDGIDFDEDEFMSTEENSTSTEAPRTKDISTTENTFSFSQEEILNKDFSLEENGTDSDSIETDFIVVTEESSTTYPSAEMNSSTEDPFITVEPSVDDNSTNSTTVKPSVVEDSTSVDAKSDSGTTLAPVLTEQVLGSVSRAFTSKPLACSLFYIYSIAKCLCLLFGC